MPIRRSSPCSSTTRVPLRTSTRSSCPSSSSDALGLPSGRPSSNRRAIASVRRIRVDQSFGEERDQDQGGQHAQRQADDPDHEGSMMRGVQRSLAVGQRARRRGFLASEEVADLVHDPFPGRHQPDELRVVRDGVDRCQDLHGLQDRQTLRGQDPEFSDHFRVGGQLIEGSHVRGQAFPAECVRFEERDLSRQHVASRGALCVGHVDQHLFVGGSKRRRPPFRVERIVHVPACGEQREGRHGYDRDGHDHDHEDLGSKRQWDPPRFLLEASGGLAPSLTRQTCLPSGR